jgi:hypothetical protein
MSFAFIPVPAENPLFNEKTVNEKWNKFMDKLCSDIVTTLELNPSDISKTEISDIITENLNKHYFIQSKTTTPTKDNKIKKNSTTVSDDEEVEEEKSTPIPTPTKTKTKTKTVVKKVIKKKVESESEEVSEVEEESDKEEEILKTKDDLKKSSKDSKILKEVNKSKDDSNKLDKDRCIEILKNNSQCKGKALLGSNLCSRHNKNKAN